MRNGGLGIGPDNHHSHFVEKRLRLAFPPLGNHNHHTPHQHCQPRHDNPSLFRCGGESECREDDQQDDHQSREITQHRAAAQHLDARQTRQNRIRDRGFFQQPISCRDGVQRAADHLGIKVGGTGPLLEIQIAGVERKGGDMAQSFGPRHQQRRGG